MISNSGRHYEKPGPLPAIIFAPTADDIESTARCLEHVQEQNYDLVGVVAENFDAARQMLDDGKADVLVVDKRTDLPPARTPRYEVVSEFAQTDREEHRRPVRINRPDAAT